MATKLNKTQQLELMNSIITTTINSHSDLLKKDKCDTLIQLLQTELAAQFAPRNGGGSSTKIDEDGNVYCNYFNDYFPQEEFNTKLNKANAQGERTEGFKANCKTAEQILRKIKALKANVTKQATESFRTKLINAEEFDTILNDLDEATEAKYYNLEEVPTPADVVGLTEAIGK